MRRKIAGRYNRFLLAGFWIEEKPAKRKSWRGNLIKYNAYKSVRSTDELYKSLFWGQK